MRFILTQDAKLDLKEIARYTKSRWGREQCAKYIVAFDKSFQAIAKNPKSGIECDEISAGYRKRASGSHIIFYRILDNDRVEIVRILHGNMEPWSRLPEESWSKRGIRGRAANQ